MLRSQRTANNFPKDRRSAPPGIPLAAVTDGFACEVPLASGLETLSASSRLLSASKAFALAEAGLAGKVFLWTQTHPGGL
jgi:hypothetical protein